MSANLEYDYRMGPHWSLRVLWALLALVVSAQGQINAAPPTVTALGFGGRLFSPAFPSVTSLGPLGYTPGFNPAFPNSRPSFNLYPPDSWNGHHHHRPDNGLLLPSGIYVLPYYAYYDPGQAEYDPSQDPYDGGPTIFDRRGQGTPARPQTSDSEGPAGASVPPADSESEPLADQPATVLVFKDGRRMEIQNYAIVGNTLWDLSDGARRKVPLNDLDLGATTKENDERGIDFRVPVGT
ncbi:MAG TPA: hypothetical protein VEK33_05325 [Terriglobales bacterium]|nr:hypothetical protein [Terriglobales bacterium]